jgi:hypothetical protein
MKLSKGEILPWRIARAHLEVMQARRRYNLKINNRECACGGIVFEDYLRSLDGVHGELDIFT